MLLWAGIGEERIHEMMVDEIVEPRQKATIVVLLRLLLLWMLLLGGIAEVYSEWIETEVHLTQLILY